MTIAITLELPPAAYEQLRRTASRQNRPVAEVVKEIVLREIPDLPSLPADVEAELASFSRMSGDLLTRQRLIAELDALRTAGAFDQIDSLRNQYPSTALKHVSDQQLRAAIREAATDYKTDMLELSDHDS